MSLQTELEHKPKAAAAAKGIDEDVDTLKSDFKTLKEDVSSLMASLGKFTSHKASEGADKTRDMAKSASDTAVDAKETVENKIRTNPLMAVGIAAGVGAAVALLSRR